MPLISGCMSISVRSREEEERVGEGSLGRVR